MNEITKSLCHHGVMGMHWGIRRYQPYGHGGYDPEHTQGRYVGRAVKAGVSAGTIGGSAKAKFGLAKKMAENEVSKVKGSVKNTINKAKQKTSEFSKSERVQKSKETAKKVAKVVAVASVVTLGVALAANSEPGKKFIRNTLIKGEEAFNKINTIDTGYSKEIHNSLAKVANEKTRELNEAVNGRKELMKNLRRKGAEAIRKKEESGIYKVKRTADSAEYDFHDWYDELTYHDKKALDAYDKVIDKLSAEQAKASHDISDYLEKHKAAYNTKRTEKLKLQLMENKERLSTMAKNMKQKVIKPSDAEMYQQQIDKLAEEGRQKLKAATERKVKELLDQNIEEDIEFIKKYLKAA